MWQLATTLPQYTQICGKFLEFKGKNQKNENLTEAFLYLLTCIYAFKFVLKCAKKENNTRKLFAFCIINIV